MLTACNGSAAVDPIVADEWASPVIETRYERSVECPADLAAAPAERPTPAADAVIEFNAPGGEYLAALVGYAEGLLGQLTDARAECARIEARAAS